MKAREMSSTKPSEQPSVGAGLRLDLQLIGRNAVPIAAIAVLYLILEGMGITCPILFFTGISCAGCGMSRAWLSVLRGDISAAFSYHPLFWTVPAAFLVWLMRRRIPGRVLTALLWLLMFLYFGVYVLRMLDLTDSIVVFDPQSGLIYRVYEFAVDTFGNFS